MSVSLPKISITIGNDHYKSRGTLSVSSIGFALQMAWFFSALFGVGIPFSANGFPDSPVNPMPLSLPICFGVALAVLLFIAATERKLLSFYTSRKLVVIFALILSLGTFALFGLEMDGALGIAYNIVSGILIGIGSAGLVLLWGVAFSRQGATTIVLNTAVAVTMAIILNALIIHVAPNPLAGLIIAALPLIEAPFLWALTPPSFIERHEEPIFEKPRLRRGAFCAHTIPSLLLFGFGIGAMAQVVSHVIILNDDMVSLLLSLFAGSVFVLLALVGIFSADRGNHWGYLFRPLVPAVMLTMFCMPALMVSGLPILAAAVLAGFLCFAALMWIFLGLICQEFRPSPFFVFGIGCAALALGASGGWYVMVYNRLIDAVLPFGAGGTTFIVVAVTIVAYALYPRVAEINRALKPATTGDAANAIAESSVSPVEDAETPKPSETIPRSDEAPLAANTPISQPFTPAPTFVAPLAPSILPSYQPYYTPQASAGPAMALSCAASSQSVEQTIRYAESHMDIFPDDAGAFDVIGSPKAPARDNEEQHHAGRFRSHCDEIADTYELSRREREVMQLLARGHNASYIQEKLCISRSTAKTHITHIYRKLDIHTQQELLTMVNDLD